MEDVRIELLRELEEYLLSRKFPKDGFVVEEVLDELTFRELNEYVDSLWSRILDLEQELANPDTLAFVHRKRLDLENSAIAKEALSRVR